MRETRIRRSGPTLREYALDWLRVNATRLRGQSERTYRTQLVLHVFPVLGDRPLDEITRQDVRALLRGVLGKGLSHATARFIQTLVSLLWNAAQDDGLVSGPVNPAHRAGRKLVFRGAKRLERRALRPDELERFLRAAERLGPRRAFLGFVVQSRTGVRTPPCSRFGARRSP